MTNCNTCGTFHCRLLKKCMEHSGGLRLQDAVIVWNEMRSNVVSSRVAFNFIRSKWEAVYEK